MSDETKHPTPDKPDDQHHPPRETPPANSPEEAPEWLQRIRARRTIEAALRGERIMPAAPPTAPAPPRPSQPQATGTQRAAAPADDAPPASAARPADPPTRPEAQSTAADTEETLPDTIAPALTGAADTASAALTGDDLPAPAAPPEDDDVPAWLKAVLAQQAAQTAAAPAVGKDDRPAEPEAAPEEPPEGMDEAAWREARRAEIQEERAQRRRERRVRALRTGAATNAIQALMMVAAAAVMIATIFTFWTPASFLSDETREGLRPAYATLSAQSPPTPIPTPIWMRRIGIVSGHWGPHPTTGRSDPGAVCDDGLTEASINRSVAQLVVQYLSGRGYEVDLLDEWDPRLDGYQASALLSIHADSCYKFDLPGATGFKVAPPASRTTVRADDERLVNCLIQEYGAITNLPLHPSITRDMTEYHSFNEISEVTPSGIIELGFLYEDRDILENRPDLMAQGIVSGLLCFLENAPPTPLPELTPWPTLEQTPTPLAQPGVS
ncbi:MAG: N-acetylmuramoyl-L-alanine amidase [Anaerolineae bacterium]|nr:N-acetylmuramoyl-L-alanine amidase [Anaerolineae bacterium]